MKARFTRGTDSRLGLRFEPETFEEQLLLEMFSKWGTPDMGPYEFRFSGWQHNHQGNADLREGLTSAWGEFVKRDTPADAPTSAAGARDCPFGGSAIGCDYCQGRQCTLHPGLCSCDARERHRHAFIQDRSDRNPDETCVVCRTDPRNIIHDVTCSPR